MPDTEYEKVASADVDAYSDASGSDISGNQDNLTSRSNRRRARTSEDVRRHDEETLTAEDEAEQLLSAQKQERGGLSSIFNASASNGDRSWRKTQRAPAHDEEKDEDDVLYDMEQGVQTRRYSGESSGQSSELDMQKLGEIQMSRKTRIWRWTRFICLHIFVLVLFILLLFGAYKVSISQSRKTPQLARLMSNGTSYFWPTTIVISLDGFRADFLQRGLTPTLNAFIKDGVSPKYMMPSFPSVTFPNHFTLATGQYPESHGIVGNTFWDPTVGKEFYYTDPERSQQPEWWNAEPFWESAELQDIRSAIHMWPGSEAHIGSVEPAYVDKFNGDEPLDNKVKRILGWLDLPGPEDEYADINRPRPQLIAAYVPDVDSDGHLYGPNSTEIRSTITRADNMLADIFRGIDERNLTNIVNIMVVSDHGMATTDVTRLIQLEDLLDTNLIEHMDGWPLYGLRPYDTSDEMLDRIYNQLFEKSQDEKYKHAFDVYRRDKDMPERYHFSKNPRIAPLWIVPKTGWAIVRMHEFDVAKGLTDGSVYHPRGLHGYDFEHPLMRAIFVARGPAFPHPKGSQVEPFQNTEVYNIICDSLGIEPAPNNGTIRLPFKTNGKHDDTNLAEVPNDPPSSSTAFIPAIIPVPIPTDMPPFEIGDIEPSATVEDEVVWTTDSHGSLITVPAGFVDQRPWFPTAEVGWDEEIEDENLNNHKSWWGWFTDELHDFKQWTNDVLQHDSGIVSPEEEEEFDLDLDGWKVILVNETKQ